LLFLSTIHGEVKNTEALSNKNKPLILIVDDQLVNRQLFSIFLNKLGYPMLSAGDGQDAMDKAKANNVDFVFMDLQMPKMNGYEAARNLREGGFKKPIIAVTASEQSDERDQCVKAGINDILIKPFKQIDVEKMLQKWIDGSHISAPAFADVSAKGSGASPAGEDVIFDTALIMENFSNDCDAAVSILSIFLNRTQNQIENFPNLEKAGDWDSARRDAHSIKGSYGSLGGAKLREAAARLENAYKSDSKAEVKTAFPLLCEAFARYRGKAEEFINSRS
jgi:CheY-like chemotaxis protein/HPt (histidine-containing phosphotransfer) domain-containing protein